MTVWGTPGPPPPPPLTPGSAQVADCVQMLLARVAAVEARVGDLEADQSELEGQIEKLKAEVKVLESERQWWRRWHLKWGPFFRAWRDDA